MNTIKQFPWYIVLIVIILHQISYPKNMDVKHLDNTCPTEAAIHALSKIDEINDKLRAVKNLDAKSLPGLYIGLVDKIRDKWSESKKVFMGTDVIAEGVTLAGFYEKWAKSAGERYGDPDDSFTRVNVIIREINNLDPNLTKDVETEWVIKTEDKSTGSESYRLEDDSFTYYLFLCDKNESVQDALNGFLNKPDTSNDNPPNINIRKTALFIKLPKVLILTFMYPIHRKLAGTITMKRSFIAPDIEFKNDSGRSTKLDSDTKKLKDLNCDLTYELFAVGTHQLNFHWWTYAKDSGPAGQWYRYDNYRDSICDHGNNGIVQHFLTVEAIEADIKNENNSAPLYLFYRLKEPVAQQTVSQQKLTQLRLSLQGLKTKLQLLQGKLEDLKKRKFGKASMTIHFI